MALLWIDVLVALAVAIGFGIRAIVRTTPVPIRKRWRALPLHTVATLVPGDRVRLVGVARARTLGHAIASGRPCILSTIRIVDDRQRGGPRLVLPPASGEDFDLEDESGRVLVRGRGDYEAELRADLLIPVRSATGDNAFGASVIERESHVAGTGLGSQDEEEAVLVDGMRVGVSGIVKCGEDGVLCIAGDTDTPVCVVDSPD